MLRFVLALVFTLSLCTTAGAITPGATLERVFADANRILGDPDTEARPLERFAAIEKLVVETFDFRGASELAFGRRWQALGTTQREEFTRLFAALLARSYLLRLTSRASLEGGVKVEYLGESSDPAGTLVRTAILRRDGGRIPVDYRMIERGGGWRVRDVVIEGISVIANYRAQLDRVLETSSIPDLLGQMRAKVAAQDPAPPALAELDAPTVEHAARVEAAPIVAAVAADDRVEAGRPAAAAASQATEVIPTASVEPAQPLRTLVSARILSRAYWLQIGAFNSAEEAGRLAARLHRGRVVPAPDVKNAVGRSLLRVRVGPFADAADAVTELLDLQTKGFDPFLVADKN